MSRSIQVRPRPFPGPGRRENHNAGSIGTGGEDFHDVVNGMADKRRAGIRVVGLAQGGIENAKVIEDLGGRGDGGAGVRLRTALFDGDRRGEALDEVDVRFFQLIEKLPGVGGKAFDIAALALGVEGVESQGRFAGSGHPGDDDELIAWNLDVEVFEVMLAGANNLDHGLL